MEVVVVVDFEPMPSVVAGNAIQPSHTPPTWKGSHFLDMSQRTIKTSIDHSLVLMEVDYDTLYSR